MRRVLVVSAALAALALAAVAAEAATTTTVGWKDGSIRTVRIHRNDIVRWVWADGKRHDLIGPGIRTAIVRRPEVVRKRFRRTGTFRYICSVHADMRTTVRVR